MAKDTRDAHERPPTIGSLIVGAVLYVVVLGLLLWFLVEGQRAR